MSSSPALDAAHPAPPVERGPVFRILVVALLGAALGFAIVDRVVGHLDRRQGLHDNLLRRDPHLGWTNRAHFTNERASTDRFGLRNAEIPGDAPPDEVRVLGMGASRVYGAGGALQDEIWSSQLQAMFDEAREPVRVLNGGVMAYSAAKACRRAIDLLPRIEPDLVFVLVSPGHQILLDPLRDYTRVGRRLVPVDLLAGRPSWLHPAIALGHGLLANSAIYIRQRARFRTADGQLDQSLQRWVISRAEPPPAAAEMLETTFGELAALARACREADVSLHVLVLPEHYQGSEASWEEFLRKNRELGAPPSGTPRREPVDVLIERVQALGIPAWDFYPEAIGMGGAHSRFYMEGDYHWSRLGHEVIARGLYERLHEDGLLERLHRARKASPR